MSTRAAVGVLGIAALIVVVALGRYDFLNEGGGDRYKPPKAEQELTFKVKVRRYLVTGQDDPRSPRIHWTIGTTSGGEAATTDWSRNMGKFPSGTYYALYVQPGDGAAPVATQEVTVLSAGVVICGPKEEKGAELPRCQGRTP